MYQGLTLDICQVAWDMLCPSIKQAADMGIINKHAGTIFVLDPTLVFAGQDALPDEALLFGETVGDNPIQKYGEIAEAKAYLSWKTGLPSRVVQQQAPHLYTTGMTKWGGSVVRDGLIVAFSGVQAVFDEMIAGWMADTVIGLCRHEMTREGGVMQSAGSFIGADQEIPSLTHPRLRG